MIRILRAYFGRDRRVQTSYKWGFLFDLMGILSGSAGFFFVAKLVRPGEGSTLAAYGGQYFPFVLIGLAFARYQSLGMSGFLGGLQRERSAGTLEAILASPAPLVVCLIGSTLWDGLMATVEVAVYGFLGMALFHVHFVWSGIPCALMTLLLGYAAFMSLGIMAAAGVLVLKRGNPVAWAFGQVSDVLGGVYFPVALLPLALRRAAWCLPITHTLEGLRLSLLLGTGPAGLWRHWIVLLGFIILFLPTGLASFQWALDRCRRDGSLGHL